MKIIENEWSSTIKMLDLFYKIFQATSLAILNINELQEHKIFSQKFLMYNRHLFNYFNFI